MPLKTQIYAPARRTEIVLTNLKKKTEISTVCDSKWSFLDSYSVDMSQRKYMIRDAEYLGQKS